MNNGNQDAVMQAGGNDSFKPWTIISSSQGRRP
jgi:hypothetical protein